MKQICIAGNIGKDAEIRSTQGGDQMCTFNVAVNDPRDKNAPPTWFGCSLWGKRGVGIQPYLTKGTKVSIAGELSTREHEGRTYLQVRADQVTIQGGGQRDESGEQSGYGGGGRSGDSLDSEEIPF